MATVTQKIRTAVAARMARPVCPDCGDNLAPIGRFVDPFCWICTGLIDPRTDKGNNPT